MESLFGPCLHVSGNKKLVPWLQSQPEAWLLVLGGLGIQPRESVKSFFAFSIFLGEQCYDATLCSLEWKDIEPVKHSIFGAPPHPPTVLDIVGLLRWVGNKVGWTPCLVPSAASVTWGTSVSRGWLDGSLTLGKESTLLFQMGFGGGKPAVYAWKAAFLKQQGLPRSVAAFRRLPESE